MSTFPTRKPSDQDREQLQADLTRLVGAGRLQFDEFDQLMDVVWSTQDKSVLERIRSQYLTYQGPQTPNYSSPQPPQPPAQYPPAGFQQPVPMAQPGAQHHAVPIAGQPVSSTMGSVRRTGNWLVPAHSTFKISGSSLHLDLRQANAASPECVFDITANMSTVEIIVPPGVYVENRMKDFMSSVDVQTTQPAPGAPRVILTGTSRGSSVRVITRQAPDTRSLWDRFFGV
ncbi:DUF1707 domain-containing protein [Corynebacterium suedekumii]|nr:DUF1707 domain-containing protein [Corynebacterium suedekumii]